MTMKVQIADRTVGDGERVFVIAEIGINHNGDLDIAKKMIDGAVRAGCSAVKFQKRTPEIAVPKSQWDRERETPWGRMRYIDYKHRIEFGPDQYAVIDQYCKDKGILWFASCWDTKAVDDMEAFNVPVYKMASASLTDNDLLEKVKSTGKPILLSTGMSTMEEIDAAVALTGTKNVCIAHSVSAYPCPIDALNLRMIPALKERFPDCPIGYSGHETGLAPTEAAVALGATWVERHVTLDRAMWGTDQAASVEMGGLERLVSNINDISNALGDGVKRVQACELPNREKLRKVL